MAVCSTDRLITEDELMSQLRQQESLAEVKAAYGG